MTLSDTFQLYDVLLRVSTLKGEHTLVQSTRQAKLRGGRGGSRSPQVENIKKKFQLDSKAGRKSDQTNTHPPLCALVFKTTLIR